MEILAKSTRFRAYQLGIPGSSFSYFDGTQFTLIEANLTDLSTPNLIAELGNCGKKVIDILHITSWDEDHCSPSSLQEILKHLKPKRIEYPGYSPHTDCGKESLKSIETYYRASLMTSSSLFSWPVEIVRIDPLFVRNLTPGDLLSHVDVIYNPQFDSEQSNNNSVVKFFRTGSFTVASLGDVEDPYIANLLMSCRIFSKEVDVMILAHHGADNGFTTDEFIKKVNPSVAVCSSNYDNQFDHPKPEIRKILNDNSVRIYTTKTGDIVITSLDETETQYRVINLIAKSEEISSYKDFHTKRAIQRSPMLKNLQRYLR